MLLFVLALSALGREPEPVVLPEFDDGSRQRRAPKVLWRQQVGRTTYRAAILVVDDRILVPSNGESWDATDDALDGLWVLDARDGAVLRQVLPPGDGERDVNGVAATEGAWFFGTDQGIVVRTDEEGAVAWATEVGGDVEGAPVVAPPHVAVGVEGGPLVVLDMQTGEVVHRVGDERDNHFAQPAALDVTGDGVADWLAPLRDGTLRAVDGASGDLLWTQEADTRRYAAPLVADVDGDGEPELVSAAWEQIQVSDPSTGAVERMHTLQRRRAYGIAWYADGDCLVLGTALKRLDADNGVSCIGADGLRWHHPLLPTRISGSPVIGDVDGRRGDEVVVATEAGEVIALDPEGRRVWTWRAGGPIETPPTLVDLDGNGRVEILVASQDGWITALKTRGRAPPTWGHWRGGASNRGVVDVD